MVDSVKTSSPMSALVQSEFQTIQLPISMAVAEATAFKQQCQTLFAEQPDLSELVLDFSATRFIDSSGIGALVICHRLCAAKGARLRLVDVPAQVMMVLSLTELDKVFDITLAAEEDSNPEDQVLPETHPSVNSKAKRTLDIVGAFVGLFLTALVCVPVAIIIKLDDGGPIFFAQTRCSWLGKRFKIWKFRSMVTDAESRKSEVSNQVEGPLFKNENDPRITKIGRFLRKTSLDEFPQFWNVLKGDMSLVGTRPPTPDEIEQYEVGQWQRLNVKPGMTGEWQVNGRSSITKFEDVIKLDLRYQENWSFFYDIKLIVKTVLVLFSKKSGAH
ncbi:STAS domain-containing protein [Leptolyngbyaceae cyanobacterium CCMR0082]|uniref:STAS domain-containing protein n=3 Tax=Adonisia TaxID=2950183 RepID=A0A6M0SEZ3_9CYAN|nr:STAS domain-containing protein [Adonisia turfae CCMR0081]NEZ67014.1 STAS domain-containing protein [Adonisia turfae CCMR0082]